MTTVDQRLTTLLPKTLASLKAAGFGRPRLFVDSDTYWVGTNTSGFNLDYTHRGPPRLGAYGNWLLGLWELYLRVPNAERYAMFQDDIEAYVNLRSYLDATPFPEKGYLNLYTVPMNHDGIPNNGQTAKVGWYKAAHPGKGALALIFTRDGLRALFGGESGYHLVDRVKDAMRGQSNIDGGVHDALAKNGIDEYIHWPSLVQHTGALYSTLRTNPGRRIASEWRGEGFDAWELIKEREGASDRGMS